MTVSNAARAIFDTEIIWDAHSGFMPDPAADLNNLQIWRDAGIDYLSIDVGFDLLPLGFVQAFAGFGKPELAQQRRLVHRIDELPL